MQKLIITAPMFTIEVDGDTERDIFRQAAFWLSLPTKCGFKNCGAPLVLDYLTPKSYKYYKLKCTAPQTHCINLGQRMETLELYFDASKAWEIFRPGQSNEDSGRAWSSATPQTASPEPANNGADPVGARKNRLIRLVNQCKDAGIRTGLTQSDVGSMDLSTLDTEIARVAAMAPQGAQ